METAFVALWSMGKCVRTFSTKWRDDGTWEKAFSEMNQDADTENLSMDSTCVKVHQSANGVGKTEKKAVRHTRSGLDTKIHAITEGLRNPVAVLLSPGNDTDSTHAVEIMKLTDIAGSNMLGIRHTVQKKYWNTSGNTGRFLLSLQKRTHRNRCRQITISTKSGILWNASFRKLNGFAGLPQGAIS